MKRVHVHAACWALTTLVFSAPVFAQAPAAPAPSVLPAAPSNAPAATPGATTPSPESEIPMGPVVETVVITANPTATPAVTDAPAATTAAPATPATPVASDTAPAQQPAPVIPPRELIDSSAASVPVSSPWSLMATIDHRWNTSPAFDLFADTDVTQFYGLALGLDVASLGERLWLNTEVGWNAGGTERDTFGNTFSRSELFTHNVHAAIAARYELLPWLAPHARMSLGLSVVDMKLQSNQDNVTFKDEAIVPMLGFGVGASVQTTPRGLASRNGDLASLRLGIRLELGYTFAGNAGFALKGDDSVRVPVTESSIGGLPRSGPSINTAAFVRF